MLIIGQQLTVLLEMLLLLLDVGVALLGGLLVLVALPPVLVALPPLAVGAASPPRWRCRWCAASTPTHCCCRARCGGARSEAERCRTALAPTVAVHLGRSAQQHLAANAGAVDAVRALLTAGADVDAVSADGGDSPPPLQGPRGGARAHRRLQD